MMLVDSEEKEILSGPQRLGRMHLSISLNVLLHLLSFFLEAAKNDMDTFRKKQLHGPSSSKIFFPDSFGAALPLNLVLLCLSTIICGYLA